MALEAVHRLPFVRSHLYSWTSLGDYWFRRTAQATVGLNEKAPQKLKMRNWQLHMLVFFDFTIGF